MGKKGRTLERVAGQFRRAGRRLPRLAVVDQSYVKSRIGLAKESMAREKLFDRLLIVIFI